MLELLFNVWSDKPIGISGKACIISCIAPSLTHSGLVGYKFVVCNNAKSTLLSLNISTALLTLFKSFIPVETIIGFPKLAICFNKGKLFISPDPILYPLTPNDSNLSAAALEKGVLINSIPKDSVYFINSYSSDSSKAALSIIS